MASKVDKQKKRIFTLKGIDPVSVEKRYGLLPEKESLTSMEAVQISRDVTPINTLFNISDQEGNSAGFYFIDDSREYMVSMCDSITQNRIKCQTCYWCRHPFDTVPIGCPIRYKPDIGIKVCTSELTKEEFAIKQEIPKNTVLSADNFHHIARRVYETEGSFCSFNCCLAYLKDNHNNSWYKNSINLLMKMYIDVFPDLKFEKLIPSPPWTLLQEYGGHMTIDQFRNESRNRLFIDKGYRVTRLPKVVPMGSIYDRIFIYK